MGFPNLLKSIIIIFLLIIAGVMWCTTSITPPASQWNKTSILSINTFNECVFTSSQIILHLPIEFYNKHDFLWHEYFSPVHSVDYIINATPITNAIKIECTETLNGATLTTYIK